MLRSRHHEISTGKWDEQEVTAGLNFRRIMEGLHHHAILFVFAMGYVPNKVIVHGDVAATADNIAAHEMLFRLGAGELAGEADFTFFLGWGRSLEG
jgi:hypothetical protein